MRQFVQQLSQSPADREIHVNHGRTVRVRTLPRQDFGRAGARGKRPARECETRANRTPLPLHGKPLHRPGPKNLNSRLGILCVNSMPAIGSASKTATWKLPYRLPGGSVDQRHLPEAIRAVLGGSRNTQVKPTQESARGDGPVGPDKAAGEIRKLSGQTPKPVEGDQQLYDCWRPSKIDPPGQFCVEPNIRAITWTMLGAFSSWRVARSFA